MKINRQILTEIILLIAASCLLGFGYTFVVKKGFFAPKKENTMEIILLQKAADMFRSGSSIFIDARHEFEYKAGHIQGAISIPLNDFNSSKNRLAGIPKDRSLIIYCDGAECNSSLELSAKLSELGFTNLSIFFGGWEEWKTNKMPIEK